MSQQRDLDDPVARRIGTGGFQVEHYQRTVQLQVLHGISRRCKATGPPGSAAQPADGGACPDARGFGFVESQLD